MSHPLTQSLIEGLRSGSLPQTILLYGPYGAGQQTIVREVAQTVIPQGESSPDLKIVTRPEDKTRVSLAQVHEARDYLSRSPLVGDMKMVVFEDTDFLGIEGQNALLKAIEEPHPSSRIILVSSYRRLLPTILSRCYQQEVVNTDWRRPELTIDWESEMMVYLTTVTSPVHKRFEYCEQILNGATIQSLERQFVVWETIHSLLLLAHTDRKGYTERTNEYTEQVVQALDQLSSRPPRELYRWMSALEATKEAVLFTNSRNQTALESFMVMI